MSLKERKPHRLIPVLQRLDRHGNVKGAGIKVSNSETNSLLCFAVSYGTLFLSKI